MTVLSLFDGMSCGQIALCELGIPYDAYYASEIDSHAIAQTQLNFPDTVQLGDVTRWSEWPLRWEEIDLILAGSPCQGFSVAGKGMAFDDPRSRLFFEFVAILMHVQKLNPHVKFLLENVRMKKRHLHVISEQVGVQPVCINSTLVSAQNRVRYYWSNIRTKAVGLFGELHTDIPQPEDREIMLYDILEENVDKKYYLHGSRLKRLLERNTNVNAEKAYCLAQKNNTTGSGNRRTMNLVSADGKAKHNQRKAGCLTGGVMQLNPSRESGGVQPYQQNRIYSAAGKSPAHMAEFSCDSYAVAQEGSIRRLTPTECARLQTIPAWYKWECSDSQQYKMTGNGWTVEVIMHILKYLILTK